MAQLLSELVGCVDASRRVGALWPASGCEVCPDAHFPTCLSECLLVCSSSHFDGYLAPVRFAVATGHYVIAVSWSFCVSRHVLFRAPRQMSPQAHTVRVTTFVSQFSVSVQLRFLCDSPEDLCFGHSEVVIACTAFPFVCLCVCVCTTVASSSCFFSRILRNLSQVMDHSELYSVQCVLWRSG